MSFNNNTKLLNLKQWTNFRKDTEEIAEHIFSVVLHLLYLVGPSRLKKNAENSFASIGTAESDPRWTLPRMSKHIERNCLLKNSLFWGEKMFFIYFCDIFNELFFIKHIIKMIINIFLSDPRFSLNCLLKTGFSVNENCIWSFWERLIQSSQNHF